MKILSRERCPEVVEVLCDAFQGYPVMRYVLGESADYSARLVTLITFFASARFIREETVFGIDQGQHLAAVALVSSSETQGEFPELDALRDRTWQTLGDAPRVRYEAFGQAFDPVEFESPHYHLNMIGVRHDTQGNGLAGRLLNRVHALSEADPASRGVSLSTENRANVSLYEHFGYRVVYETQVSPELRTWAFFRPN